MHGDFLRDFCEADTFFFENYIVVFVLFVCFSREKQKSPGLNTGEF